MVQLIQSHLLALKFLTSLMAPIDSPTSSTSTTMLEHIQHVRKYVGSGKNTLDCRLMQEEHTSMSNT